MHDRLNGSYALHHQHSILCSVKLKNKSILLVCIKQQLAHIQLKTSDSDRIQWNYIIRAIYLNMNLLAGLVGKVSPPPPTLLMCKYIALVVSKILYFHNVWHFSLELT